MPGPQELIALGIVALVAGRLLWRRWSRHSAPGGGVNVKKGGDCGDCASAGPAPKEATVHFYRRQGKKEGPASGAPEN